jgi:hypothetical protein
VQQSLTIKLTDPAIKLYYESLKTYGEHNVSHEGATETAFSRLLADTSKKAGWTLIPKQPLKVKGSTIFPDGTLRDHFSLPRGYWEAKDTNDDLGAEIKKKIAKKYPLVNTIFEDTRKAVLFQNKAEARHVDLTNPQAVADLRTDFYRYTEPNIVGFNEAVEEFKERVPDLAKALVKMKDVVVTWSGP